MQWITPCNRAISRDDDYSLESIATCLEFSLFLLFSLLLFAWNATITMTNGLREDVIRWRYVVLYSRRFFSAHKRGVVWNLLADRLENDETSKQIVIYIKKLCFQVECPAQSSPDYCIIALSSDGVQYKSCDYSRVCTVSSYTFYTTA